MKRWRLTVNHIKHQQRYVQCIMQGSVIVAEVENLNPNFVSNIVDMHNEAISDAYKEGSDDTKKICQEIQKIN